MKCHGWSDLASGYIDQGAGVSGQQQSSCIHLHSSQRLNLGVTGDVFQKRIVSVAFDLRARAPTSSDMLRGIDIVTETCMGAHLCFAGNPASLQLSAAFGQGKLVCRAQHTYVGHIDHMYQEKCGNYVGTRTAGAAKLPAIRQD